MELFEASGIWSLAIGKTMVHSLWIGLLILALFRFSLAFIPVRLSRIRYGLSVSALFLLFFSVLTVFLLLYEPASSRQDLPLLAALSLGKANIFIRSGDPSPLNSTFLFAIFGYIYLAGVLFMLGRSLLSLASVKSLQNSACIPSASWQARFLKICDNLGIKRKVTFLESDRIQGPMLVAYLKPAVIVPAGMLCNLPVDQVETILIHELYHLKRRDYLVNIMQLFIEGILFYHPVAWLISTSIRSEREHCCDDGVLRFSDNPVNYAKALIHIAEQQSFTRLVPGAVGSEKHQFNSRIKRILNYNTMKTNMRDKVLALSLLAGSLVLLLTISSFSAAPSFIKNSRIDDALTLMPDTIPEVEEPAEIEEIEEPDWEAIKEEIEEARMEALAEIEELDWEAIKEEMEEARMEALAEIEEIEWEAIREEMEEARAVALEEIEEIDWEALKEEIKESHMEAMKEIEEIDWEEIRAEMEFDFSEMKMDMEEMKLEIQKSMDDIDWEEIKAQIKEDLEKARISLDSLKIEMNQ